MDVFLKVTVRAKDGCSLPDDAGVAAELGPYLAVLTRDESFPWEVIAADVADPLEVL